jgi:hypothetical protein
MVGSFGWGGWGEVLLIVGNHASSMRMRISHVVNRIIGDDDPTTGAIFG